MRKTVTCGFKNMIHSRTKQYENTSFAWSVMYKDCQSIYIRTAATFLIKILRFLLNVTRLTYRLQELTVPVPFRHEIRCASIAAPTTQHNAQKYVTTSRTLIRGSGFWSQNRHKQALHSTKHNSSKQTGQTRPHRLLYVAANCYTFTSPSLPRSTTHGMRERKERNEEWITEGNVYQRCFHLCLPCEINRISTEINSEIRYKLSFGHNVEKAIFLRYWSASS